ncbi:DoxX family protein [Acrocarpospora phusangensis]|uniref:DoxX family protein n=1 Tax=Acrocarpospora phusangensis TaxID=1070424 RepID=UPI00194EB533|nr:DoxX family protein [Acrocarpospora phusangensis]
MNRTFHDLASLAARLGVGGIFFAQGWQKLEAGLLKTGDQFAQLGAPAPKLWAGSTMLIELIGGTLLVAGLAVSFVGMLLFAEALAVFILTAGDAGLPLTGGDISLIVALGAASVLLSVNGAGRLSVDHMVVIKRRDAEEADDLAAEAEADAVINALREPRPEKKPDPKGPVTFPASASPSEEVTETLPKPRGRRPKRPEETTESKTEAPAGVPETPRPAGGESGDTLVAGRRTGKAD